MAKILVLGPNRVLGEAMRLFLFPDHEVQVGRGPQETEISVEEYELLIVQRAGLQKDAAGRSSLARSLEQSEKPVLWIEEGGPGVETKSRGQSVLSKPLERESFAAAVDQLLFGDSKKQKARSGGPGSAGEASESKRPGKGTVRPAVIDLVDVAEEGEGTGDAGKRRKRRK